MFGFEGKSIYRGLEPKICCHCHYGSGWNSTIFVLLLPSNVPFFLKVKCLLKVATCWPCDPKILKIDRSCKSVEAKYNRASSLLHSFICKTGDISNLPPPSPPSHPTKKGLFRGILSLKLPISKLLTKQNTLCICTFPCLLSINTGKDQNPSGRTVLVTTQQDFTQLSSLIHVWTEALVPTHLQFHPRLPQRWALIHTSLYIPHNLLRFPSICDKTGLPIETKRLKAFWGKLIIILWGAKRESLSGFWGNQTFNYWIFFLINQNFNY